MVHQVEIMPRSERLFLLDAGSSHTKPMRGTINQMIEEQVCRTPQASALHYLNHQPISYQQLNDLANQVARCLPSGRGAYIPLVLPRSAELIIILLAILKVGAAYVTLDPNNPVQRMPSYMKIRMHRLVSSAHPLWGNFRWS